MKIRLHEIEFGVKDAAKSHRFYSDILELNTSIDHTELKVFESGNPGLDFNVSTHIKPETTVISFLTDDITEVIKKLQMQNIIYQGPEESHLGMSSIRFNDLDGNAIRVNQPGKDSPSWLEA